MFKSATYIFKVESPQHDELIKNHYDLIVHYWKENKAPSSRRAKLVSLPQEFQVYPWVLNNGRFYQAQPMGMNLAEISLAVSFRTQEPLVKTRLIINVGGIDIPCSAFPTDERKLTDPRIENALSALAENNHPLDLFSKSDRALDNVRVLRYEKNSVPMSFKKSS